MHELILAGLLVTTLLSDLEAVLVLVYIQKLSQSDTPRDSESKC
jgi:hypothetical protein